MSNDQTPHALKDEHSGGMNRLKSLARVWDRTELPPLTRLVALYLADNVDPSTPFRVKLADICRWVNAFSGDVMGSLWQLESAGIAVIDLEHPPHEDRSIHDWCGHAMIVGELFPAGKGADAARFRKHAIFLKTKKHCYYCGVWDENGGHQIEHCVPKARGGTSEFYNLVGSCPTCNQRKGTLTVEEFRAKIELQRFGPERGDDEYHTFAGEHGL